LEVSRLHLLALSSKHAPEHVVYDFLLRSSLLLSSNLCLRSIFVPRLIIYPSIYDLRPTPWAKRGIVTDLALRPGRVEIGWGPCPETPTARPKPKQGGINYLPGAELGRH
jgi:hypothetical protein